MTHPLRIGLSPRILHQPPAELGFRNKTLQYLEQSVAHWIMRRRALAFMLRAIETGGLERSSVRISDYVREIDGLVLQGGGRKPDFLWRDAGTTQMFGRPGARSV